MVKSMIIAILFLAFLASANAAVTVRTTTVITTTMKEEEMNPGQETQQQYCGAKEQAMQLQECMTYISEGGPYGLALRMVVMNPGEQMLQQCCQKLANVPEECRCEVIAEMMRVMEQQQGQGEQQMKKTMQLKNLPKMCNMEPQVC